MKKTMMAAAVFAAVLATAAYAETNEQAKVQSGVKFGEAVSAGVKSPAAGGLASQKSVSALSQAVSAKGPGGPGGPGVPVPGAPVPAPQPNHPQPQPSHEPHGEGGGGYVFGAIVLAVILIPLCVMMIWNVCTGRSALDTSWM